jgi:hypothetical protein
LICLATFQISSEQNTPADRTAYVNLHVDVSPAWMQKLVSTLNVSTPIHDSQAVYDSQMKYFQSKDGIAKRMLPHLLTLSSRLSSAL